MKKDIHPTYYPKAKVECACGNKFEVGSTQKEIRVEICNACHPFYTGEEKIVDTEGRVERFKTRMAAAEKKKAEIKKPSSASKKKEERKESKAVKSKTSKRPEKKVSSKALKSSQKAKKRVKGEKK